MNTYFYNRTMYAYIKKEVPSCFLKIDDKFDSNYSNFSQAFSDDYLGLTSNLCRRMGDIDLYSELIEEAYNDSNPFRGAQLIGSYLVGYFGGCKSLMDAGSIIINKVYQLGLSKKQQDFDPKRGGFWGKLKKADENAFNKYHKFQSFFSEVIVWRNFSVHRATPIVMVHGPTKARQNKNPNEVKRKDVTIKMIGTPDVQQDKLVNKPKTIDWINPLEKHENWRPKMIDLCNHLCKDIETKFMQS